MEILGFARNGHLNRLPMLATDAHQAFNRPNNESMLKFGPNSQHFYENKNPTERFT